MTKHKGALRFGESTGGTYCWVYVKDGYIIEVGHELGREGGTLWEKGGHTVNYKNGVAALKGVAKDWPGVYEPVRLAAYNEKIPPLGEVQEANNRREISILRSEVRDLEKLILEKNREIKKLQVGTRTTKDDSVKLKRVCFDCRTFNPSARGAYKCATNGSCPGLNWTEEKKARVIKRGPKK